MNLIVKDFNTFSVRILLIDDREWFIAKDIAELLGYENTNKAIIDHCKNSSNLSTVVKHNESLGLNLSKEFGNNHKNMKLILESDVWRLIIKSHLPESEKIEAWIMEEVLPSIRKTGNYSISQNQQTQNFPKLTKELNDYEIYSNKLLGFIENLETRKPTTLFRFDKIMFEQFGKSPLEHFEIDIDSQFFLPTELGRMINKSPVEVNLMLEHKGFQIKENGVWQLTESGCDFGISIVGKYNQIKWKMKTVL